jgi:hypothetical protein
MTQSFAFVILLIAFLFTAYIQCRVISDLSTNATEILNTDGNSTDHSIISDANSSDPSGTDNQGNRDIEK